MESELAIEPERARLDRFLVVLADLVGIHRNTGRASQLMQQVQDLGIDPSRLTLAKCIERVKPDLNPLEEPDGLEVVDRHAVFQSKSGIVRTQRKPPLGIETPNKQLNASANIGLEYIIRIAVGGAMQFAITDRQRVARHVDDLPAFASAQLSQIERNRGHLGSQ